MNNGQLESPPKVITTLYFQSDILHPKKSISSFGITSLINGAFCVIKSIFEFRNKFGNSSSPLNQYKQLFKLIKTYQQTLLNSLA